MIGDDEARRAVHETTRALLRAEETEDVAAALERLVRELGGDVTGDPAAAGALDVDIAVGTAEPRYPVLAEGSEARRVVEEALAELLADVDRALDVTSRIAVIERGAIEPDTGAFTVHATERVVDRMWAGDTLVCVRLDGLDGVQERVARTLTRTYLRVVRDEVRLEDHIGRTDELTGVLLLRNTPRAGAEAVLTRLRRRWRAARPREITFSAGICEVSSAGGGPALEAAGTALDRAAASGGDAWGAVRPREDAKWDPSMRRVSSSQSDRLGGTTPPR